MVAFVWCVARNCPSKPRVGDSSPSRVANVLGADDFNYAERERVHRTRADVVLSAGGSRNHASLPVQYMESKGTKSSQVVQDQEPYLLAVDKARGNC